MFFVYQSMVVGVVGQYGLIVLVRELQVAVVEELGHVPHQDL